MSKGHVRTARNGSRLRSKQTRGSYDAYIASSVWKQRRYKWAYWQRKRLRVATLHCLGCGEVWTERSGEIHHLSYENLGKEKHEDLINLCRSCHRQLHAVINKLPDYLKTPKKQLEMLVKMNTDKKGCVS